MAEAYGMAARVEDEDIAQKLKYSAAAGLHAKVISRLKARRMLSERAMSKRYDSWNKVDESCRLFIDLSRKAKKGDGTTDTLKSEIPWARSIVVPMSYAILQVYLTQLMGIFTRRDPPLEIQGVGMEDVRPAKLMNAVIAHDQVQTNYILQLYTAMQDALKYGLGGFHDCWEEKFGYKQERATGAQAMMLEMMGQPTSQRAWRKLRQYNKIEAWDPFNFYPDPRVSLSNLQDGEFCGHRIWRGYLELLAGSQENGGIYFNIDQIPKNSPRTQNLRSRNRFQASQMNLIGSMDEKDKGFHAIDSYVVSIIPEEWELGDGYRPEKWQFTWVDDQVIIRAHPADYEHGDFNYSAFESNIDTHVFGNQGSIENLDGLQRFMDWSYNSHIQNLIRFINNRMIFDPSLVQAFDVENPDAAMHIRLTPLGQQMLREGRLTLQGMIQQLQLTDVTTPMVQAVNQMFDFAMRMSGAADQMMGATTKDKRTLGEVSRVGHEGSMRMAMHAIMMDVQGMRPTALRWCANRQQYTDEDMFVRIAGDMVAEFGGDRIKVRPGDLQGNFDYVPKTGPEPGDPGEMAGIMFEGLGMIMKSPEILAIPDRNGGYLDPHEFIKEGLRDRKVHNVNDFYRKMGGQPGQQLPAPNVQVVPDEEVQKQAQAGNVVPIRGAA